jgi:2'-5' RNA ligase
MTDVISIELLLDAETEARVRADWKRLADAGLSSLGAHRAPSNRPHITMLVRATLPSIAFTTAVGLLPVRIDLAEPVTFTHGDRAVFAWRVVPTEELHDLHRAVHAAAGEGEDAPHTAPGAWTPHITLARRLRLASLPEALNLIGLPLTGTGVALRRWDSASSTVTPVRSMCDR